MYTLKQFSQRLIYLTLSYLIFIDPSFAYIHRFDQNNFYTRVYGGTGWAPKTQKKYSDTSDKLTIKYHPTINTGFNLGYRYEHWRTELEYAYFKNKHSKFNLNNNKIRESGDISLRATMVNLIYDFSDEYYVTIPYFGIGIGSAMIKGRGYKTLQNNTVSGNTSEHELSWQGMLGIGYYFNRDLMLDIGYRHFGTSQGDDTLDDEYHTDTMIMGLTYHF